MTASPLKAFRVTLSGVGDGIYFAASSSKAKSAALLQAKDAGFRVGFPDLRCRRAPEFDDRTYCGKTPDRGIDPMYFDRPAPTEGVGG